ncbi:MAG: hypothetical protein AAFW64_05630 [Pseudomonadota bacterium]
MVYAVFSDTLAQVCAVLCSSAVTGVALRRYLASRSANKYLYATVAVVAGCLSVIGLADVISGHVTHPIFVVLSLVSPVAWALTLWVAWTPSPTMVYAPHRAKGPTLHARGNRALRSRKTGQEPSLQCSKPIPNASSAPAFHPEKPVPPPHWPMPLTLEFLPRTDRTQ